MLQLCAIYFQAKFKEKSVDIPEAMRICYEIRKLQLENIHLIRKLGYDPAYIISGMPTTRSRAGSGDASVKTQPAPPVLTEDRPEDGTATRLKPELGKTLISLSMCLGPFDEKSFSHILLTL